MTIKDKGLREIRHLEGPSAEFTACSLSFDAFECGDSDAPIVFAKAGENVNCAQCLAVVDYYRKVKFRRSSKPAP